MFCLISGRLGGLACILLWLELLLACARSNDEKLVVIRVFLMLYARCPWNLVLCLSEEVESFKP